MQLVGNDLSVKLADFGLAVTDTPDNTQRSASGFQVIVTMIQTCSGFCGRRDIPDNT